MTHPTGRNVCAFPHAYVISDGTPPRHRLRLEDFGEVLGPEDQEIERMFSDDVDPVAREPAPVVLRVVGGGL